MTTGAQTCTIEIAGFGNSGKFAENANFRNFEPRRAVERERHVNVLLCR